jgi:hypothetical protein
MAFGRAAAQKKGSVMTRTTSTSERSGQEYTKEHSLMNQASEAAESVGTFASHVGEAIKERPYTTMAIASGLAFAVGALWMLQRHQRRSNYAALLSRLPNLPDRRSDWTDYWAHQPHSYYEALRSRLPSMRNSEASWSGSWTDYLPTSWRRYWQ